MIFGATGDLTKRLLIPALCNLRRAKLLPEEFAVVAVARSDLDDEAFRRNLGIALGDFVGHDVLAAEWKWLANRIYYHAGTFDNRDTYGTLKQVLAKIDQERHTQGNYLFYLATPPQAFSVIVHRLGDSGLVRAPKGHWRRVVIEKPFGTDLPSAQALDRDILGVLAERQIYRIDHYLGKETVQNIMVLRFANGIFEPLWNRNHIDHVQITVAETLGVEQRGKFYDATGALRDMVPSHLFQLLTLVAMEPPTCFDADAVRTEKTKVLDAVHCLGDRDMRCNAVRGQYVAGTAAGESMKSYRDAPNVAPGSTTETYVALKLMVDNWRWAGVPFYLRTGKALARRRTEIAIQFKRAPLALFRDTPVERLTANDLVLHIQPDEAVTLRFGAKIPGPNVRIGDAWMKFDYKAGFAATPHTGYETLIYDCMMGDATLFNRADSIEAGWRVVQPVLDAWAQDRTAHVPTYPAGSSGPSEADRLLTSDGRQWRALDHANGEA